MSSHALAVAILWIAVALGVSFHATATDRGGVLWGVLTLFTGVFGLFGYAIAVAVGGGGDGDGSGSDGPDRSEVVRICPECSAEHDGTPNYCGECGEALSEDDDWVFARVLRTGSDGYCSHCKSKIGLDAETCPDCGALF